MLLHLLVCLLVQSGCNGISASVHLGVSQVCSKAAVQSHHAMGISCQTCMFWLLLTLQYTLSLVTKWTVYISMTVYMRVRCTAA